MYLGCKDYLDCLLLVHNNFLLDIALHDYHC